MMNRHYEYFVAILRKNDKNDKTLSSYFFECLIKQIVFLISKAGVLQQTYRYTLYYYYLEESFGLLYIFFSFLIYYGTICLKKFHIELLSQLNR